MSRPGKVATDYEEMTEGRGGWCRWVQPIAKGYRMACCDCDLVHELAFRVRAGRIQFRARRLPHHTAALRRKNARKAR